MMRSLAVFLSALATLSASAWAGDEKEAGYAPMAVFEDIAGRAWRGEGTGPNGQPIVDIAIYEFIMGGRALQSTHRLAGGDYGGRTIYFYDEGAKEYIFHYFTTAGFHTTGSVEPVEGGFKVTEKVIGHPEFAAVLSTMMVDGSTLRVETSHIDHDGKQSAGDTLLYQQIDHSGVLF